MTGVQTCALPISTALIHRYQYPAGKDAEIILDMDHSADKGSWGRRIINSQIRILNDHAVEGYRIIT